MLKRKNSNSLDGESGDFATKEKNTDEPSHQDTVDNAHDDCLPVTDPSILHDKRVLLVEKLHLESILPGVTSFLQYPEVDTINAESRRGGRIGKLIDYLHRRVAGKSYGAFSAFMKMIAGCQPELFKELTGRAPTQSETLYCIKGIEREVKECIKDKGHSTDSALDETIDLDSEHMQLTIVKEASYPNTSKGLLHSYQSHQSDEQKEESNISAKDILDNNKKGEKPHRISLYGPAGIGKSTTTQWLARQWAKNKWASEFALLFLLQLRMLAVSDCSMTAIELLTLHGLFQITTKDNINVLSSWLKDSTGKILIFIDGIDEVTAFRTRLRNCPKITDLNQKAHPIDLCLNILRGDLLPGCTVISASRPFSGLGELSFDKQCEIIGLNEANILNFVEKKHPSRADHIKSYLRGNPILMSICGITFYCGLISSLLAEGVVFTNDDLKTYTRLIAFIIIQSVIRKMSDWPFVLEVGSYFPKLSNMAYMGIFGKQLRGEMSIIVFNEFDMNEVELSPQELNSIQRAGLLQIKKIKTGRIHSVIAEFFHLAVQEMLASAYLLSNPPSSVNIFKQLFSEGQFNMSLLYLFGLQFDAKSPWIKNIVSSANRSQHGIRFDVIGQMDYFLEDLCKRCRFKQEFTSRLLICQLLHEGQMESKAKWMAREIAPDGKLHISSTPMTIIDLMAVRFVCQYNALNEISICFNHFTSTQIEFLISSLLGDHAATLHTLDIKNHDLGVGVTKAIGEYLKQNHCLQTLKVNGGDTVMSGVEALAEALEHNNNLQRLELYWCSLGDSDAEALAEGILHNSTLKILDVCWNEIREGGGKALAEALQRNSGLQKMSIQSNDIGPIGAKALGQALQYNRTLETLNVIENKICIEGVSALAGALHKNDTLRKLDIAANQLRDDGAKVLAAALEHNNSLQELDVSVNEIGNDGASALAKALEHNNSLQELDVKFNEIGEDGASALANALQQNRTVHVLNISYNNISRKGGKAFAAVLHNNDSLHTLDLSSNKIDLEGILALAEAIDGNVSLRSLNLRSNAIDADGTRAIAEALKHNAGLEVLDLASNKIEDTGAKELAEALQENTTLQTLTLAKTDIALEGITDLSEALSHNNTLRALDLHGINIGDKGAKTLAKALHHNSGLQSLSLGYSNIGQNGAMALIMELHCNRTLRTLDLSGVKFYGNVDKVIAEALHHNDTLENLHISLGKDGNEALSELLEQDESSWHYSISKRTSRH